MAEFLRPVELAERWQVTPRTVRAMCQAGELPSIKVGKLYRIPADALNRWERANRRAIGA